MFSFLNWLHHLNELQWFLFKLCIPVVMLILFLILSTIPHIIDKLALRFHVKHCSKCGKLHRRIEQRYCRPCHADYMRQWRRKQINA